MLDRRLAVAFIAMCLISAMAVVAALLPQGAAVTGTLYEDAAEAAALQDHLPETRSPEKTEQWLYLLRDHSGFIAVYSRDLNEPTIITRRRVRHLPDYDRTLLSAGIEIFSNEELAARLEDYDS